MRSSQTCDDCNRKFTIEFDESDGTLQFCPFCGTDNDGTQWGEDEVIEVEDLSQGVWDQETENF